MRDVATAWPIAAMSATLDRDDAPPNTGDAIPSGWHWQYFLETKRASDLAPEGLPRRGEFLPPVELPQRMWAGGRLEFFESVRIGDALARESKILSVEAKQGKSGSLVFVTVGHTVRIGGKIAVAEEHDIVYREAAKAGTPPAAGKPAPANPAWRREIDANTPMLFRYSALIFNAHRIHYDIDYCRAQGYPGIVVHGPLQTVLMLDLARRNDPRPVKKLDYRAYSPLFHTDQVIVAGSPVAGEQKAQLWTTSASGNIAMSATAFY